MRVKLKDANRELKVEDFKFHKEKKNVTKLVRDNNILESENIFKQRGWTWMG